MGNDINIKLNDGGSASATFWKNMMSRICADLPTASFREKPSNVKNVNGEYYVDGTYSKTSLTKTGDSADENDCKLRSGEYDGTDHTGYDKGTNDQAYYTTFTDNQCWRR